MKDDIKLPPLPDNDAIEQVIYAHTGVFIPQAIYDAIRHMIQEYSIDAIKADRQRRSEPVVLATYHVNELSRAVAQAVLQLPEIQALRKDAERYRYLKKGGGWVVAATQTGWHVDGEELDDLIDNEMED